MHILIGLVIATFLVIGWACGNVFACVFLTLGGLFCMLVGGLLRGEPGVFVMTGAMLVIIWAPIGIRMSNARPAQVTK